MGQEIVDQLGGERPTHVFLQAGVGAMAGALTGFFADYYGAQDAEHHHCGAGAGRLYF